MAIAFQAVSAAITGVSGSSGVITWPGAPSNQQLIAVFGFESEAAGSGPYINDSGSSAGWRRIVSQAPSATGSGLEVWAGSPWTIGATTTFNFTGSYTYVGRGLVYTGEYFGVVNDAAGVRGGASAQVVGNNPAAPSIYAYVNEMLVACAADTLTAGYGNPTPTGWSAARFDSARSGAGTVEITAADFPVTVEGNSGTVPWTATASPGGAAGGTAILAIRPLASAPSSTSPLISVTYSLT